MDDLEARRMAAEMLRQFPDDAVFIAAMRADAFLDQGDMASFEEWKRIVAAINQLDVKPDNRVRN